MQNQVAQWVLDLINHTTTQTRETDSGTIYIIEHGPDLNPNAPAEMILEVRGSLPDFKFHGEIRRGTLLAPFEGSAFYSEGYFETLDEALKPIIEEIPRMNAANGKFKKERGLL
jgi:hypothetical protein